MTSTDGPVSVDFGSGNGPAYPFSLDAKLAAITEPCAWYTAAGAATNPWGRAVLPMEMISVLANKAHKGFPVRGPALGLFAATVLLHSGVFKESFAGYPKDRLT